MSDDQKPSHDALPDRDLMADVERLRASNAALENDVRSRDMEISSMKRAARLRKLDPKAKSRFGRPWDGR
jgi:hypothetical protein